MPDTVISAEHLSKAYRLGKIGTGTLAGDLKVWWAKTRGKPNPVLKIGQRDHGNRNGETIWVLKDVSFEVKQGEVLGIIGRNGAGKSTLLKIITGVTAPTSGQVKAKGRVASLLEVGTGFHPELTGRENIYLNGAILGMTRVETKRKFDEIVAFSGVEQFIDTPVKRYSSGMYVRLAFSVAAHLEPEILLVDEVLAVGDAEFQKKCLGKMGEAARGGRTVLFVSHNMPSVQALCGRALLLTEGIIGEDGPSSSVVAAYLSRTEAQEAADLESLADRTGSGVLRFASWSVYDEAYGEGRRLGCSHACTFRIRYALTEGFDELRNVMVSVTLKDPLGLPLLAGATHFLNSDFAQIPQRGAFICRFDHIDLLPGSYKVQLWSAVRGVVADYVADAGSVEVLPEDVYGTGRFPERKHGLVYAAHSWALDVQLGQ
jgi:lipopolysaccharide transport system ATP-binding protein